MVLPAHPKDDDVSIVGGIPIGPGMMLSLNKIDYFYDFDWLGDPNKMLQLEITHVGEVKRHRGPNDDFDTDWVIIVGHEYVRELNVRCHCVAVRVSALENALTAHERVTS